MIGGIDPGKHVSYLATFDGGKLKAIDFGDPPNTPYSFDVLYVEKPRVYPGIRTEDPNDLIDVAMGLQRAISSQMYDELVVLHPRTWKGTIKKAQMLARIRKILTASGEIEVLKARGLENQKDALDACGIVLYALGRLTY